MSDTALSGAPPAARSEDSWSQQQSYNFSGRVLLTAVVILFVIAVVFAVTRVLLYYLVVRPGGGGGGRRRGGLAGGILRSLNSLGVSGRRGLDASALAALPVTAYRKNGGGAVVGGLQPRRAWRHRRRLRRVSVGARRRREGAGAAQLPARLPRGVRRRVAALQDHVSALPGRGGSTQGEGFGGGDGDGAVVVVAR